MSLRFCVLPKTCDDWLTGTRVRLNTKNLSDSLFWFVFHAYANEEVEIVDARDKQKTAVTGIEIFCKLLDSAEAGDKGSVLDA